MNRNFNDLQSLMRDMRNQLDQLEDTNSRVLDIDEEEEDPSRRGKGKEVLGSGKTPVPSSSEEEESGGRVPVPSPGTPAQGTLRNRLKTPVSILAARTNLYDVFTESRRERADSERPRQPNFDSDFKESTGRKNLSKVLQLAIPKFTGTKNYAKLAHFLNSVRKYLSVHPELGDIEQIMTVSSYFEDNALTWWQQLELSREQPTTYDELEDMLLLQFIPPNNDQDQQHKLESIEMKAGWTLAQYQAAFQKILTQFIKSPSDGTKASNFVRGLRNDVKAEVLRNSVLNPEITNSFQRAEHEAIKWDQYLQRMKVLRKEGGKQTVNNKETGSRGRTQSNRPAKIGDNHKKCFNCGKPGHFIKDCKAPKKEDKGKGKAKESEGKGRSRQSSNNIDTDEPKGSSSKSKSSSSKSNKSSSKGKEKARAVSSDDEEDDNYEEEDY
ncbi:hypothetical protein HDU97_009356 [Phlyctochytrium planicorne]|nr:hypothetical protein HDU97_009356 [Phlyctochytrium planicorne]